MKRNLLLVGEVLLFCGVFMVCVYAVTSYYFADHLLIPLTNITSANVLRRLWMDFLLSSPALLIFALFHTTVRKTLNIDRKNGKLCILLLGILILSFFLFHDFTTRGIYIFLYNLVIVALAEEIVFRGYIYQRLKKINAVFSFFMTGCLFGIPHAIIPAVTNGSGLGETALNMVSLIGWGIIQNGIFTYLLVRSNTLYVPIMFHALGNYFWDYGYADYMTILECVFLGCFVINDIYVHKKQIVEFFTKPTDYV